MQYWLRSLTCTLLFGPQQFVLRHPDILACPILPLEASNLSRQASPATDNLLPFGTLSLATASVFLLATCLPPVAEHLLAAHHFSHASPRYLQRGRCRIPTCLYSDKRIYLRRCDAALMTPAVALATPPSPHPLRHQRVSLLPRLIHCLLWR